MANYETAGALQTYFNSRVKKINDLIQELPDISEFEDVIDDIFDVSKCLFKFSAITDEKLAKKLEKVVNELCDSLSEIKKCDKYLKGQKLAVGYNNETEETEYTKSLLTENEFLSQRFPKISG